MCFKHLPYLYYIRFALHLHFQTPQSQLEVNIATDDNQRQEIAHTIQDAFTSGDGEKEY
jgi:hypothetical protein